MKLNGSEFMLAEERFARILSILEESGSVTVAELMERLDASESTIRRDLNNLDARGQLIKVHGGAMMKDAASYRTQDDDVQLRKERNVEQKVVIARYAAHLISDYDVVYLDAGTTTELMIDPMLNRNAMYVTNARHGVFGAVGEQVIQDAPQMPPVRQDPRSLFGVALDDPQLGVAQFILVLAQCLAH